MTIDKSSVILLGEYGSTAMGTSNDNSDHDLMGAYVPPVDSIFGLTRAMSIRESDAPEGARSAPGEYDITYHPAQKFAELLAHGNPTMIQLLFLPEYAVKRMQGEWFVGARVLFISKKTIRAYLGYMNAQVDAVTLDKKQRPELVEKYGYDTKFAYHAIRLGMQGVELAETGELTIPFRKYQRQMLTDVREGAYSKEGVIERLAAIKIDLEDALAISDLQDGPDYASINELLVDVHESWYEYR